MITIPKYTGYNGRLWNESFNKIKEYKDLYEILCNVLNFFLVKESDFEFKSKSLKLKNYEITPSNYGFAFKEWREGSAVFYSHNAFHSALLIQKILRVHPSTSIK